MAGKAKELLTFPCALARHESLNTAVTDFNNDTRAFLTVTCHQSKRLVATVIRLKMEEKKTRRHRY